ncbi:hypothetical protein ACH4GP_17385 [Streptomyces celluloflavus]|uniref:Uncharacterized protein n=1 Tax=Streptomyces celluloflavus TaxID=58344 RepID=A0ABW7RDL3_9ACTN
MLDRALQEFRDRGGLASVVEDGAPSMLAEEESGISDLLRAGELRASFQV